MRCAWRRQKMRLKCGFYAVYHVLLRTCAAYTRESAVHPTCTLSLNAPHSIRVTNNCPMSLENIKYPLHIFPSPLFVTSKLTHFLTLRSIGCIHNIVHLGHGRLLYCDPTPPHVPLPSPWMLDIVFHYGHATTIKTSLSSLNKSLGYVSCIDEMT
jgi:hypothetical protein